MSESNQIEPNSTSVLFQLYAMLFEIDVAQEGVRGAKHFFEAKVSLSRMLVVDAKRRTSRFSPDKRSLQSTTAIDFTEKFARSKNNGAAPTRTPFVANCSFITVARNFKQHDHQSSTIGMFGDRILTIFSRNTFSVFSLLLLLFFFLFYKSFLSDIAVRLL